MTKLIKSIIRNIQLRVEDRENEREILDYASVDDFYRSFNATYCEQVRKGLIV